MRLGDVEAEMVVRNRRNKSFYLFVRLDDGRARIRPLELFPTGRLVPKPTDTVVSPDLDVEVLVRWHDDFAVQPQDGKHRDADSYHVELTELEAKLEDLQDIEASIVQNARGSYSKGSHANRILAVTQRIAAIRHGMQAVMLFEERAMEQTATSCWQQRQLVRLPSGRVGRYLGPAARNCSKVAAKVEGRIVMVRVPENSLTDVSTCWTAAV